MSVISDLDIRLPDAARQWIFERGGSALQRRLMEQLWRDLKQLHPDADCRPKNRFVGLYLSQSTSATFARIDSRKIGPVIGVESVVVNAYGPSLLQPLDFQPWGFQDPRGFLLEESSLWELLELLDLAYRRRQLGWRALSDFRSDKEELEKQSQANFEFQLDEEPSEEGKKLTRTASVAERDPKLRAAAIRIHGLKCAVCGFDFEAIYGERGKGFIEVHHNDPLGERAEASLTDPRTDLDVVCSNCHRMIHRQRSKMLTISELKQIVEDRRSEKPNRPRLTLAMLDSYKWRNTVS